MPSRPKKPCAWPGCPNLVDKGYCKDHEQKVQQGKAERNRYYDSHIRDEKAAVFYNSPDWIKTREYVLAKHKGLDLYAFFMLKTITPATTVHHIVELQEDWSRRLDVSNLFPISESNHNAVHAMYKKDKKNTQKLLREILEKWKAEFENG